MTTPATGSISIANLQTVYGVTSLGGMRTLHPSATSAGGGIVSLASLRGVGNAITGWFDAASFTGNSWVDKSTSNNAPVTRGNVTSANLAASNGVPAIAGATTDGLRFTSSLLPNANTYTLFHMTRYVGSRGRIFDATTGNWLSGFHASKAGTAFHQGWLTPDFYDVHGFSWVMSADRWTSYRSNKVDRTTGTAGTPYNFTLGLNDGAWTGEVSQWQCAEVVAFNRQLANAEIYAMESYLADKYYVDLPRDPYLVVHAKDAPATAGQVSVTSWGIAGGSDVSANVWADFACGGTTVPTALAAGGPSGGPCVRFSRARSHHFNAGTKTFNLATNGGFTAVATVKFSGVAGYWERIFDFSSGADTNNIILARNSTSNNLSFTVKSLPFTSYAVQSATIVQEEWAVYACRYNAAAGTLTLFKNGVLLNTTPSVPLLTDRTLSLTYIGRSPYGGDSYLNGDISKFLAYDRALTDAEIVAASGNGSPPQGPRMFLDAATLTSAKSSAIVSNVSTWNGFTAANVPQLVNPMVTTPAPHFFSIDRTQSQYMDAGPRTFNISTNGGFTAIMYTRFTGTINAWERLVNFNSGPYTNEVAMLRSGSSADLVFGLKDGSGTFFGAYAYGTIVQNEWAVWVGRYTTATNSIQIYKNNANVGALGSVTAQSNKTVGNTWLGRITGGADQPLNADISAFAAYDRSLTDAELTEAYNSMVYGTSAMPATPVLAITPPAYTNFASYKAPSYVSFVRPSTQYLDGGTRTFSCGTNGGFTALAVVRFTGTAVNGERIFDFSSGSGSNEVVLWRSGTTANIAFAFNNGVSGTLQPLASSSSPITQGEWAVYACRMTNATGVASVFKNNAVIANTSGVTAMIDRTLSSTFVAKSFWSEGASNVDVQSFVVYDRGLTDAELTQAYVAISSGLGAVPPNPVLNLSAAAPMSSLAVATWGPMTATGSPILTSGYAPMFGGFAPLGNPLPAVPRSGYLAKPHVDLVRANAHSFNGGSRTLSIHANGGFTALAHVRFNGAPTAGERIFDFGNAASNNNIVLARGSAADPSVTFAIYAPTAFSVTIAGNANVIIQNQWAVLGCRYKASNNFMQLFKDGVHIASGTGPASSAIGNRTVANTFVGASHFGDLTANMSVRSLVAYDRALSDAEMTTAHGCMVYGTGTLPNAPAIQLDATNLLGTTLTTWGSFAAVNSPTVYPAAGPLGGAFVTLARASSQHLTAGTQTFELTKGFTAIAHVRFTGTVGTWERIFDFSNGPDSSNVLLTRLVGTGQLLFRILVGVGFTEYGVASSASTIVQGEWAVYACRYDAVAGTMTLYKDGALISTLTSVPALTDRTLSLTYVGRSAYGGNAYLNGDLRFLGVYNRALSDSELTSAYAFLANGNGSLPGAPMLLATVASLVTQTTQTPTFTSFGTPQAFHTGGFGNGPYVQLSRAVPHYFDAGARTLNSSTNRGFTGIAMVKFKGSVGVRERLFDIPGASYSLGFCRNSTNPQLQFFAASVANASNTFSAYSTNCVVADEWAVFACRYVAVQQSMQIFKNNANVGAQGSVPATAFPDQSTPAINVGRSNWPGSDAYTNADMKCVFMYDRALTDAELTQAFQYCTSDAPAPPIAPLCALHAKDLVLETNKGFLPAWPAFGTALANGAGFQSGTTPGPRLTPKGGYGDQGYVTFDRVRSQYLFSPTPVTFRLTTNGGFTAISHVKFTHGTSGFERIFDFHDNGVYQNAGIKLYRLNADPTALTFVTGNSTTQTQLFSPTSTVTANQWAVFACRYIAATTTAQLFKNNILIATSSAAAVLPDMTLSNVWVGRSWVGTDSYLSADMRFFGMYDRALTDAEMTAAHSYVLKSEFAPSAAIKSFGNLKLWLDAEHFGRFASGNSTWTDLSASGYDFTVSNTAIMNSGNAWHMNFSAAKGVAKRVAGGSLQNIVIAGKSTFVTFSALSSTSDWRTLIHSAGVSPAVTDTALVIANAAGVVGEWWSSPKMTAYTMNSLPNVNTQMNMTAFRVSNLSALPFEVLAAPAGTVVSVGSVTNVAINTGTEGFASVGGFGDNTASPLGASQWWGNLASFMYFDRLLSTAELQVIYNDQWARYGLVTPSVRATSGLILWLDAEYSRNADATTTNWKDLSDSGYDFTVAANAFTTAGGISYMNFSSGVKAQRSVGGIPTNVPLPDTGSTVVTFTAVKNGTSDYRTLMRSNIISASYIHLALTNINNNMIGQYYDGNYFTSYDITALPNLYTKFNFMAFQFFSDSVSTWVMFAAPNGVVAQVASFGAAINTVAKPVRGFCSIGGLNDSTNQSWGNIASFMAYNRRLSLPEMQAIYDENKSRFAL